MLCVPKEELLFYEGSIYEMRGLHRDKQGERLRPAGKRRMMVVLRRKLLHKVPEENPSSEERSRVPLSFLHRDY